MKTEQDRAIDSAACEPRPPSCSCGDRHIPGVPHERWASPTCPTHGATRRAFIRRALEWHCDADVIDLLDAFERDAGEAERTAQAVAREREACAVLCETWTNVYPGASYARGCAARIRARATSPAPCVCGCPASEHDARNIVGEIERDCAAHGCERYYDSTCTLGEPAPEPVAAERAVVEAAVAWRASLDGPGECWHEARIRDAVDALAAARKGG